MNKSIKNKTIYFYDNKDNEIMYIDYSTDECIWYFLPHNVITIKQNMELYNLLNNFMKNNYIFNDDILINYKDKNKLIWYSDCYYNPSDNWSVNSVSCLNIEKQNNEFKIWCTKKIDEIINRPFKSYGICFSPLGNGKYSKNLSTGLTLQDEFIIQVYQPLIGKINKKLIKNI